VSLADTITLRDGTVIEGTAIQQGDRYWIRSADGKSRFAAVSEVSSIVPSRPPPATQSDEPATIRAVRYQAAGATCPLAALAVWMKFADGKIDAQDAATAREQIEVWRQRVQAGWEKVANRWLDPTQRAAAIKRASDLNAEAFTLANSAKPLQAVKKVEEALAVYPNSYPLIFQLAWINVMAQKADDALRHYEECMRRRPFAYEPINNAAIIRITREEFEGGLLLFHKAAEIAPIDAVAKNLIVAAAMLPDGLRKHPRFVPALELAAGLSNKLKFVAPAKPQDYRWIFIASRQEPVEGADAVNRGIVTSQSGVLVSEDGLVVTVAHGLDPAAHLLAILDDGTLAAAHLVAVDKPENLALIRIGPGPKCLPLALGKADGLQNGAAAYAVACMKTGRMGGSLRAVEATIKAGSPILAVATLSAGYTGGALVDPTGGLLGILTPKTVMGGPDVSESPVIGIDRLRAFLQRQKVAVRDAAAGGAMTGEDVENTMKKSVLAVIGVK
jgi:S1-C subfamily serine protease